MSPSVLCVDESPMSFYGVQQALRGIGIELGTRIPSVEELLRYLEGHSCDVIVSEMRLHDLDVVEAIPEIKKVAPNAKLIIYCYVDNPTYAARASAADAWDFVLKTQPISRLIESIQSTSGDERPRHSLLLAARAYLFAKHHIPNQSFDVLTKREQQILAHLSLGLCNREISFSLDISLETAKEHVQNVLRKIKVSDRTAAAVWAIRNGLPPMLLESAIGLSTEKNPLASATLQANSA